MGIELEMEFIERLPVYKQLYIKDENNIFLKLDNDILGIFTDSTGIKFICTKGRNIKYDFNSCKDIYTTLFIKEWLKSLIYYDNLKDFERIKIISKKEFFKELNRIKNTYLKFEKQKG